MKKKENYDENIEDVDEITGTEIKINPDYYIHKTLVSIGNVIETEGIKNDLLPKYKLLIKRLEILCKSSGRFDQVAFDEKVKEFKASEEYKKKSVEQQEMLLCDLKQEYFTSVIFDSKTVTGSLKG